MIKQENINKCWYITAFIVWILFAYWAIKSPAYTDDNSYPVDEYELQGGGSWGH